MRTEPLAAINSVALAIGRFPTLNGMLEYALQKVLEVLDTEAGSVYLLDEERGVLTLTVSHGLSDMTRRDFDNLKLGEGLSGRVAVDAVPIVVRNLKDDPRLTRMAARSEGFRAFAAIPLRSNFKTYGTLNVYSRSDLQISEADVQLLTSMAAQIGLAVGNARLYMGLQASERKFRGLVENAEDVIYMTDPGGMLTYVNPAAGRLLGFDADDLCAAHRSVLDLVYVEDRDRFSAALNRMLSGEVVRALEFRMMHASGDQVRWFSQTNVPIRNEAGQLIGIHGVAHDITQRKAMQAQIANAERLADLGRMAATIAHEIRNPLGAIVNSVTVLRRPGGSVNPRLLEIVSEEAGRLDEIIRDFLLFARPPDRAPIACDLVGLIGDTAVLFRRDQKLLQHVRVIVHNDGPLPLIQLDPNQIKQVLWNLLKNAAEATAGGGRIDVRTTRAGDHVVVSITDDGPGIQEPAAVFEPFYTTRPQGTGLGLTVVARVIRDHGGEVAIANTPGRGACVSFRLPVGECGVPS